MPIDYVEVLDPDSELIADFHDNVLVEAFPDKYVREDIPILRNNVIMRNWMRYVAIIFSLLAKMEG